MRGAVALRRFLVGAVLVLFLLEWGFGATAYSNSASGLVLKFPEVRSFAGVEAKVLRVGPNLPDSMPLRFSGSELVAEVGFYEPGRHLSVLDGPVRLGTGQVRGGLGTTVSLGRVPAGFVEVVDSAEPLPWWDAVVDRVGPASSGDWAKWPYADWENLTSSASPLWSVQGGGLSLRWPSVLDSVSGGEVGTPWYSVPAGGMLRVEAEVHGGFAKRREWYFWFFAPSRFYAGVEFDTGTRLMWFSEGGPLVVARDVPVPEGAQRYRFFVGTGGDSAVTALWIRRLACGPAGLPGFAGFSEPPGWGYADSFDGPAAQGSGCYPGWSVALGSSMSSWYRDGKGNVWFYWPSSDYLYSWAAVAGPWADIPPGVSEVEVRCHFKGWAGTAVGVQFDVGSPVFWGVPAQTEDYRICARVAVPAGATRYRPYVRVDRHVGGAQTPYVNMAYLYVGPSAVPLADVPEPPGVTLVPDAYPANVSVALDGFYSSGYRVVRYSGYLHVTVTQWGGEMYSVWRDLPSGCASLRVTGDAYLKPHDGDVGVEFDVGGRVVLPFQAYQRSQVDMHVAVPSGARAYRLRFRYDRYSDIERPAWDLYSLSVSPEL